MTENNDVLFAGDPHGSFKAILSAVLNVCPKAIILLGDYNLKAPLEQYLRPIIGLTQIYPAPQKNLVINGEDENVHISLKENLVLQDEVLDLLDTG